MRNEKRRAKLILERIEQDNGIKRLVVFKDKLIVSREFYDSLRYLVGELGWTALVETKEFKRLSNLVVALANEAKEKKRMSRFCDKGKAEFLGKIDTEGKGENEIVAKDTTVEEKE